MSSDPVTEKVVCYIVRDGRLLVLEHLDVPWQDAGLQVPAGSVKPGETLSQAAHREACEETGLASLRVVARLGESRYDMAPYRSETQHRHFFHLEVDSATPERWTSSEDDPDDGSGRHRFVCYWVPISRGHALAAGQGALLGRL